MISYSIIIIIHRPVNYSTNFYIYLLVATYSIELSNSYVDNFTHTTPVLLSDTKS